MINPNTIDYFILMSEVNRCHWRSILEVKKQNKSNKSKINSCNTVLASDIQRGTYLKKYPCRVGPYLVIIILMNIIDISFADITL